MGKIFMSQAELDELPTFVGFYTIDLLFTEEEAAAREAERRARKKARRER